MTASTILPLAALAAMLPASILAWRRPAAADLLFWLLLGVAFAGSALVIGVRIPGGWSPGLGEALWATIATVLLIFALLLWRAPVAARLGALLFPYLLIMAVAALLIGRSGAETSAAGAAVAWLDLHIVVSLATYALVTLAAVAGLAVLLQERALKRRAPTALSRRLPSVADGERLELQLMAIAAFVLGIGLLTGMATAWLEIGRAFLFDHKTIFAVAAFFVILLLLWLRRSSGLRGRRAARIALLAYLLLTLAYLGVKVVTQLMLGR
ncbi:MAG: cytochrome c biogenesis protein CcsA [Dongiaceae bacterium]